MGFKSHISILQSIKIFRCLYRRCPPLPIPNREVKPARADGTAVKRGRVGRCPILKKAPYRMMWGFSCLLTEPADQGCAVNVPLRKRNIGVTEVAKKNSKAISLK